jgi:peptide/nickel transport system substrate-binding protein
MNIAINRDEIIEFVMNGHGEPLAMYSFWPSHPSYDPSWPISPYDPEQARQLLEEAGYGPGDIEVDMLLSAYETGINVPIGEAVGSYWEQVGITVNYIDKDWVLLIGEANQRELAGSAYSFQVLYYDEPVNAIWATTHSNSYLGWGADDPELDKLIDAALVEVDDAKRAEISREMGKYMIDNITLIPIAYSQQTAALSDKIESWDYWPQYFDYAGEMEYISLAD